MDKLKNWYKLHKSEVSNGAKLGFYFAIIISIPFIAIIFALFNGTDKALPSQGLFTGIIAYCGIIISFWGIYWKTMREEEKSRREKEEKNNHEIRNIRSYIRYIVDENLCFFNNKKNNESSIEVFFETFLLMKRRNESNLTSYFIALMRNMFQKISIIY